MIDGVIRALINYAVSKSLIDAADSVYCANSLLSIIKQSEFDSGAEPAEGELNVLLDAFCDEAAKKGIIDGGNVSRELLDTAVMGVFTPRPSEIIKKFTSLYAEGPEKATDFFYKLSEDTNYIRRDRIAKMLKWRYNSQYGDMDITVNLAKPEKDPKDIAAALKMPQTEYPKCMLCRESEGYAGRLNFPARQNHRLIPIEMGGEKWFLQYSPYVYYNEHCIVLNSEHTPMRIDRSAFEKLLEFVTAFPHYFIGSNADLPVVGGSILSHEHFQGGRYTFAMETAPTEKKIVFKGFEDIEAGTVRWPMSTIRLKGKAPERIAALAEKILLRWREYSDSDCFIFAETEGRPHNTVTPIARRRGADFELDLVLRNNIATQKYPLGVFHPHPELHHIKKENIGLIEVMGLAVLPARLKAELEAVEKALLGGKELRGEPLTDKHAAWVDGFKDSYAFTRENCMDILKKETGRVFAEVLEQAGVYKRNEQGFAGFSRFIEYCGR